MADCSADFSADALAGGAGALCSKNDGADALDFGADALAGGADALNFSAGALAGGADALDFSVDALCSENGLNQTRMHFSLFYDLNFGSQPSSIGSVWR